MYSDKDSNLTCTVLLHYLVKVELIKCYLLMTAYTTAAIFQFYDILLPVIRKIIFICFTCHFIER